MKNIKKILFCTIIIILALFTNVEAHNKNITGCNEKDSKEIIQNDGKYYGYHNENEVRHYHQVEWDEENQKWKIVNPAVYYDENFKSIDAFDGEETERIEVEFYKKVDGDTAQFKLNGEIIKVRFLGINTPETVDTTTGIEPYGEEASNYTVERLENAKNIFRINLKFLKCEIKEVREYLMQFNLDSGSREANELVKDILQQYNYKNIDELRNDEKALSECIMKLYNMEKFNQNEIAAITKTSTSKVSKIIRKKYDDEVRKLKGLYNYINEFSLINQKEIK